MFKLPRFNIVFKILLAVFFVFLSLVTILIQYILIKGADKSYRSTDYIVVFGAAINPDGTPSDALEDRLQSAVDLYRKSISNKIILSGAPTVYNIHEVDVMRAYLINHDIPNNNIILDYYGHNTCNTLKNIKLNFHNSSFTLLSNDFHLARIAYIANKFNLDYSLFGVESVGYVKRYFFVLREAIGILYLWVFFDGSCENGLSKLNIFFDKLLSKLLY